MNKILFLDIDGVLNNEGTLIKAQAAYGAYLSEVDGVPKEKRPPFGSEYVARLFNEDLLFIVRGSSEPGGVFPNFVIDNGMYKSLLAFVQQVGAKIVISSSWRILAMEELYSLLGPDGANVLYPDKALTCTPRDRGIRGEQIREWFNLANIEPTDTNYIIIDDDSDFLEEQNSSFVRTYYKHGLNAMALEQLFFFAEEKGWI